jgi:hypothetical protein
MPKLKKNSIAFASIDAKEVSIISLRTQNNKDTINRPEHIENVCVLDRARLEYLERLEALQKEIIAKYQPLIKPDTGKRPYNNYEEEMKWAADNPEEYQEREDKRDGMDGTEKFWHLYYT